MAAGGPDPLDTADELLRHLRPIEHLFRVMAEVEAGTPAGESIRRCSEIGLALTERFRASLNRSFRPDVAAGDAGSTSTQAQEPGQALE